MEDLKGKRYGMWTVIKRTEKLKCLCKCDCGTVKEVNVSNLRNGSSASCGCVKRNNLVGKRIGKLNIIKRLPVTKSYVEYECMCDCGNMVIKAHSNLVSNSGQMCCHDCRIPNVDDISGQRFGRLTAIRYVGKSKGNQTLWECRCDCGKTVTVHQQNLKSGHTKSCGCYNSDALSERNSTHGESNTRIYNIWHDMIYRCYGEKHRSYKDYGVRGITVCKEWKDSFENFKEWSLKNGYSENLSIDRMDVNGNYEPSNCRWATPTEQQNNTRRNLVFTIDGYTDTLPNLCRKYNMPYVTVHSRIYAQKWDIKRALTQPIKHKRARN